MSFDPTDLADLARQALAARDISVTVGPPDAPRHITLRVPTQYQTALAARRAGLHMATPEPAAALVLERQLQTGAVVGWHGVLVGDVLPQHPQAAEPLPFDAAAVELLLDAQPQWGSVALQALMDKMAQRAQVQEAAAKN